MLNTNILIFFLYCTFFFRFSIRPTELNLEGLHLKTQQAGYLNVVKKVSQLCCGLRASREGTEPMGAGGRAGAGRGSSRSQLAVGHRVRGAQKEGGGGKLAGRGCVASSCLGTTGLGNCGPRGRPGGLCWRPQFPFWLEATPLAPSTGGCQPQWAEAGGLRSAVPPHRPGWPCVLKDCSLRRLQGSGCLPVCWGRQPFSPRALPGDAVVTAALGLENHTRVFNQELDPSLGKVMGPHPNLKTVAHRPARHPRVFAFLPE